MNGFTTPDRVDAKTARKTETVFIVPEVNSVEIEQCVRRGRLLRAAHLAVWGQQMMQNWKSLFRRPGRLVAHPGR